MLDQLAESLRRRQPPAIRRGVLAMRVSARRISPSGRPLPSFLIIGAQRCGTTSLFHYLAQHPDVAAPLGKELQFFSLHHRRGVEWYRSHFDARGGAITFEASPYYLFHPSAAERAARLLPDARLIVLLRNPIDRAFSHYQHSVGLGQEPLPFDVALDAESARLAGKEARLVEDPTYKSFAHRAWSYQARGDYSRQLVRWLRYFPREQLKVVLSEDFYKDTDRTYNELLAFVGLDPHSLPAYETFTRRPPWSGKPLSSATRDRLEDVFCDQNRRLATLVGRDIPWSA